MSYYVPIFREKVLLNIQAGIFYARCVGDISAISANHSTCVALPIIGVNSLCGSRSSIDRNSLQAD